MGARNLTDSRLETSIHPAEVFRMTITYLQAIQIGNFGKRGGVMFVEIIEGLSKSLELQLLDADLELLWTIVLHEDGTVISDAPTV